MGWFFGSLLFSRFYGKFSVDYSHWHWWWRRRREEKNGLLYWPVFRLEGGHTKEGDREKNDSLGYLIMAIRVMKF